MAEGPRIPSGHSREYIIILKLDCCLFVCLFVCLDCIKFKPNLYFLRPMLLLVNKCADYEFMFTNL